MSIFSKIARPLESIGLVISLTIENVYDLLPNCFELRQTTPAFSVIDVALDPDASTEKEILATADFLDFGTYPMFRVERLHFL